MERCGDGDRGSVDGVGLGGISDLCWFAGRVVVRGRD